MTLRFKEGDALQDIPKLIKEQNKLIEEQNKILVSLIDTIKWLK